MTRSPRRTAGMAMFRLALGLVVMAAGVWIWSASPLGGSGASADCPDGPYDPDDSDARAPVVVGPTPMSPGQVIHLAKGCRQWADITVSFALSGDLIQTEIRFHALDVGESYLFEPAALRFGAADFVVCRDESTSTPCSPLNAVAEWDERVTRGSTSVQRFTLDPDGADTLSLGYRPLLRRPPDTAGMYCEDPFSMCFLLPSTWPPGSRVFTVTTRVGSLGADLGNAAGVER